jgi:hypothetical protein
VNNFKYLGMKNKKLYEGSGAVRMQIGLLSLTSGIEIMEIFYQRYCKILSIIATAVSIAVVILNN